jgi:hypothetical protein
VSTKNPAVASRAGVVGKTSINAARMRKLTILPLDTGSYSRFIRNGRDVKTGEVAQAKLAVAHLPEPAMRERPVQL